MHLLNAPLNNTNPNRVNLALKEQRRKCTELSPFMKLFWKDKKKISSIKSRKYRPMIIRICLSLAAKFSSVYDN